MGILIIVEGKNDKKKLAEILDPAVEIICTYGTISTDRLEEIKEYAEDKEIYIWTDNDTSGKRIRAILRETFPDAEQIYTHRGYAGVEGTPIDYLIERIEKAGLDEWIVYPAGYEPKNEY